MTNKYVEIFNYLRQCPQLSDLWSIAGTEDVGNKVILPQGASQVYQYNEQIDIYGNYACDIIPYPSVYEDYQINCFSYYDANDSSAPADNVNILELQEVQEEVPRPGRQVRFSGRIYSQTQRNGAVRIRR